MEPLSKVRQQKIYKNITLQTMTVVLLVSVDYGLTVFGKMARDAEIPVPATP